MHAVRGRLLRNPLIARLKPSAERAARTGAPLRFFVREAAARRSTELYALRGAPQVKVALRHGTLDILAFDELFCQGIYDVPVAVAAAIDALGRPPRVLDLGANVGLFAAWASARWPAARVTCVEPDPANAEVLRRAAAANGGAWEVVDAAAGAAPGEMRFRPGRYAVSRAALPGEEGDDIITVPVIDALDLAGRHDVVKLDIEGGEWDILADPRMADLAAAAITLEYHPELCPADDTHAHAGGLLEAAGWSVERVPLAYGAPEDNGGLWAWRP
jgi:FkbM family methyltransferase